MLVSTSELKTNACLLKNDLEEILEVAKKAPVDAKCFSAHITRMASLIEYVYYVSVVNKFCSAEHRICDCGGQYGQVTKLLSPHFNNVTCYLSDRNQTGASYYHQALNLKKVAFGEGSQHGDKIFLPSDHFDAVISSGVLEHVREHGVQELASLKEINRILNPGGQLFIWMLPRHYSLLENLYNILGRSVHKYKYKKEQIVSMIEGAGLTVTCIDAHGFFPITIRSLMASVGFGCLNAFLFDYYFSKCFPFIAQHFFIIAQKPRR